MRGSTQFTLFTLFTLSVLVLLCAPSRAQAYCLRQSSLGPGYASWKVPVVYRVATTAGAQRQAAIDAAFAAWAQVSCSTLAISKGGGFAAEQTAFDDHAPGVFVFWYATAAGFPAAADVPATTLIVTDGKGGIVQASIAINGFAYAWASDGNKSAFDLQAEMTSLVGSVLGLRASKSASSVMTGSLIYGDTSKRQLQPDDEAGLRYLYGDASCAAPPAPGPDGCAAVAASAPAPSDPPPSAPAPSAPPPSTPPPATPPPSSGGSGCASSAQCAADQVCTAEGTCVLSDGTGSGAPCASYVECEGGEICTAEGSCARLGQTPAPAPAPAPAAPAPPAAAPADEAPLVAPGRCTSSDECGAGAICSAEGLCFGDAQSASSGCAVGGAPAAGGPALLALLALLALAWRSRR